MSEFYDEHPVNRRVQSIIEKYKLSYRDREELIDAICEFGYFCFDLGFADAMGKILLAIAENVGDVAEGAEALRKSIEKQVWRRLLE